MPKHLIWSRKTIVQAETTSLPPRLDVAVCQERAYRAAQSGTKITSRRTSQPTEAQDGVRQRIIARGSQDSR